MSGGSKPKGRKATCHTDRKHWARGLCKKCYQNRQNHKANGHQIGLVRVPVRGWGSA